MTGVGRVVDSKAVKPAFTSEAERTVRLHDGEALFYFRDLTILGDFIKTLGEAGVEPKNIVLETVTMSNECWERLPLINPDNI